MASGGDAMGLGESLDRVPELYTAQFASAVEQQEQPSGLKILTDMVRRNQ
jgi:hypothetical protein